MKVLLDTNAYSALMRGKSEVAERVRKAERVLMSTIVVGELMFGFRNGTQFQQNSDLLESFLANRYVTIVPVTLTTLEARVFCAAPLPMMRHRSYRAAGHSEARAGVPWH
jgi:predicted nucleic acid-binding protein